MRSSAFDPAMIVLIQENAVQSAAQTVSPPPMETIEKTRSSDPVRAAPKLIKRTLLVSVILAMLTGLVILPLSFLARNSDKPNGNDKEHIAGVDVNQDVEQQPANQEKELGQVDLAKGVGNAIGNLLGITQPSVKSLKVFSSYRSERVQFIYGYDLMITIENPTPHAIENLQLIVQNRTDGRTVANKREVVGGHVPGGVEKHSIEQIGLFVVNEDIGLVGDYRNTLPKGNFLEIAIQKVIFANGEVLDLSKSLTFVRGVETAPDEEYILDKRRNTIEWKMQEAMQEYAEKGLP